MEPSPPSPPSVGPSPEPPPPRLEAPREQEQSIKARKQLLFEQDEEALRRRQAVGAPKPFVEYLKTTPPAPLAPAVKASLWTAGAIVVLLFLAALLSLS